MLSKLPSVCPPSVTYGFMCSTIFTWSTKIKSLRSTHNQKKPNVLLGQISTCNCMFIYNKPIWNSFTIQKTLCWLDVVVSIGRSPNTNFILAGDVSRDGCVRTKVPSGSFGYRMRGSPNKTRQFGLRFFFDGHHVKKVKIGVLICLFQEVWGLFKNTPQRNKTPHLCWTPVVIQDSSKVNLMRVKI